MSDRVYVPNTFPTPNVLVDSVMPSIGASAFKVLIVITRLTLGWSQETGRQAVEIGMTGARGLCQLSGLSHQSVISAVRELKELELILVRKGPRNSRTRNQYALNLDLTTGQLVKNLDQSKNLSSATSQIFRPKLVKIFDSLKGRNQGNTDKGARTKRARNEDADPRVITLLTAFREKYRNRVGTPYPVSQGKDQKLLKQILSAGVEESAVLAAMDRYFADDYHGKNGFDVGRFRTAFAALNSAGLRSRHNFDDGAFASL